MEPCSPLIGFLKRRVICEQCGEHCRRLQQERFRGRWNCIGGCTCEKSITDYKLLKQIEKILYCVYRHKELLLLNYFKDQINKNVQHMITTEGDKGKYVELIRQLNDKIAVLNKQLEIKREKIAANPSLKAELENIKETLSDTGVCFSQYDDVMIRRLVGLIRVMKDRSIVIFLKGGLRITEVVE